MKLIIEALSLNYNKYFGYQEYLFNLLKYIMKHRNEVMVDKIIILCKDCDISAFEQYQPVLELRHFEVKNSLDRYILLNTLGKKINLCSNDIILFTNNYSSFRKYCRHILVIHDLLYLRKEYAPNLFFRLQRFLFVPRSVKIADRVIGISKWVKNDIVSSFNKDSSKVIAIYNNFDFSKFESGIVSAEIIRLCENNNYFLVVCASAAHKNTISTLLAFEKYKQLGGRNSLIVLGKFSDEQKTIVAKMAWHVQNDIHNISNISNADLGYLYKNAFAYISATLFEGLGMPIVEAMYFGLPCIVSDLPVIREVTDNLAIYFNPLDINQLVHCMFATKYDANQSDIQKKTMQIKYSGINTIGKYIALINEIADDKK